MQLNYFKNIIMNKLFFIFYLTLLSSIDIIAQNECPQLLKSAHENYKEGKLYNIEKNIIDCIESKNGFTKTELAEAYKLLTLTCIFINENEKAEKYMCNFLKINPTYKINSLIDPAEWISLYCKFKTNPIVNWGISLGISRTYIQILKLHSLDNSNNFTGKYYHPMNFNIATPIEVIISKRITISTPLSLSWKSYILKNELFNYSTLNFKEQQTTLDIPIMLRIHFVDKKITPYFNFGTSFSILLNSKATATRKDDSKDILREVSGPDETIHNLRKPITMSIVMGLGCKIKNKSEKSFFTLDLHFSYGLHNIVKTSNRYQNSELIYQYFHLDNDLKMHSYTLTTGYHFSYFKPTLKRKYRKKSK